MAVTTPQRRLGAQAGAGIRVMMPLKTTDFGG
jgi:hypothetical protein